MGRKRKLLTMWDAKANAARRRRKGIFGLSQQDISRMQSGKYKKPGRKKKSIFSGSYKKGQAGAPGTGCLVYIVTVLFIACLIAITINI